MLARFFYLPASTPPTMRSGNLFVRLVVMKGDAAVAPMRARRMRTFMVDAVVGLRSENSFPRCVSGECARNCV